MCPVYPEVRAHGLCVPIGRPEDRRAVTGSWHRPHALANVSRRSYNLTGKTGGYVMRVNLATTRMSSKGQVVIPESVREVLGLRAGVHFIVLGHGDTVMLKVISPPSADEFEATLKQLRHRAKAAGLTRKDVARAISEVRDRK